MEELRVPVGLRHWFVVHFAADLAFALPLMVAPEFVLGAFGWTTVDPVAARLVAAALFAIGTESLLMRDASAERFRTMLRLKCLWSGAAVVALGLSLARGAPPFTWAIAAIFVGFSAVWHYYRVVLAAPRAP
jgi:hypothetical protein